MVGKFHRSNNHKLKATRQYFKKLHAQFENHALIGATFSQQQVQVLSTRTQEYLKYK